MNTVRDVIKFGMPYYHFEVLCTGKSGSPTFPKFVFRCQPKHFSYCIICRLVVWDCVSATF
jgi:hypothetical protein